MGVEAVAGPGLRVDEVVAGVGQQAELGRAVLEPDRRQVALAKDHPGDREGIARIALAGPPGAASETVSERTSNRTVLSTTHWREA